jgi:uncharacterized protein with NAD-binding domain and iron-sulfur cluster
MSFRVVTDRVEQLASELDGLAARFDDVAQSRVAYEGAADARHAEDGLREFFGKWTDGMDRLHQQLTSVATHLHSARAAYESGEQEIVHAARGKGPS